MTAARPTPELPALLAQHDHVLDLGVVAGGDVVRLVLVLGLLVVAAAAVLTPFVPVRPGAERQVVTGVAAGVTILLLLGGPLTAPDQVAVVALAAALLPVLAARRPDSPAAGHAERLAPWVVVGSTAGAAAAVLPTVLGTGEPAAAVRTGLLVAVAGLGWLVLCRPSSRRAAAAIHALGWVLGNAVLAGATAVVLTGPSL